MSILKNSFLVKTIIFTALITAFSMANSVQAKNFVKVNCERGDSIQNALSARDLGSRLRVIVIGTCVGDVIIKIDDVTIEGEPLDEDNLPVATINGAIKLYSARRVTLENLRIIDADIGIYANKGASFTAENVIIEQHSKEGVLLEDNATGEITNSNIMNNIGPAVKALDGAQIKLSESMLQSATMAAVAERKGRVKAYKSSIVGKVLAKDDSAVDLSESNVEGEVTAVDKSSVNNGEVTGGDVKAEQQSSIKGTKAMTGHIEAKEQSAIIDATAVMGNIKAEILSSIKNSTALEGNINAEIQSTVFDSSAPEGTVTADFLSIAKNNEADVIARHRSIVTEPDMDKDVSLESQSAGNVLEGSAPDCDPSSSVFEDYFDNYEELPEIAETCLENNLDHFFDNIFQLDFDMNDPAGQVADEIESLWQKVKTFVENFEF